MASAQWMVIFALLLLEGMAILLFILPLPKVLKRWWMSLLHYGWSVTLIRRILITLFVLVFVFFVDTLRAANSAGTRLSDPAAGPTAMISLMRAQRNAYLCGTTLFLLLVLHAFQSLLTELFAAEAKIASASKGDEDKVLAAVTKERDEAQKHVSQLDKEIETLSMELRKTAALKSQVMNQQKEYERVLDENKKLLDQITAKSASAKKDE